MRIPLVAFAITALMSGPPAFASDQTGKFAVKAPGQIRCQTFTRLRAHRDVSYDEVMGFVEGYMTAANRYEINTYDLAPWHNWEGLGIILANYCQANPNDHFVLAVEKLVAAMRPIRLAQSSPLIAISDGTHQTRVYEMILKRAQDVLRRRGLYSGPPDGRDSPELRTAFLTFQKSAGLSATGVPDNATLWKLLNP